MKMNLKLNPRVANLIKARAVKGMAGGKLKPLSKDEPFMAKGGKLLLRYDSIGVRMCGNNTVAFVLFWRGEEVGAYPPSPPLITGDTFSISPVEGTRNIEIQ